MLTRLAWPPEMPRAKTLPMRTSRHCCRPSLRITRSTRCFFSSSGTPGKQGTWHVYDSTHSASHRRDSVSYRRVEGRLATDGCETWHAHSLVGSLSSAVYRSIS